MCYELMSPDQIREAIDKNTLVALALGGWEYHGEHLCPGVDTLPFMSGEAQKQRPIDHTGEQETSLMMTLAPEEVDMGRFDGKQWYAQSAVKANMDYANKAKTFILGDLKKGWVNSSKMAGWELTGLLSQSYRRWHI